MYAVPLAIFTVGEIVALRIRSLTHTILQMQLTCTIEWVMDYN